MRASRTSLVAAVAWTFAVCAGAQELRNPFPDLPVVSPPVEQQSGVPAAELCAHVEVAQTRLADLEEVLPVLARVAQGELTGDLKDAAESWARAALETADEAIGVSKNLLESAAVSGQTPEPGEAAGPAAGAAVQNDPVVVEEVIAEPAPSPAAAEGETGVAVNVPGAETAAAAALEAELQNRALVLAEQKRLLEEACEIASRPRELTPAEKLTKEIRELSGELLGAAAAERPPGTR